VENISANLFFKVAQTEVFWNRCHLVHLFSGRRKVPWDLDLLRITWAAALLGTVD